jgi:hypothetical protein
MIAWVPAVGLGLQATMVGTDLMFELDNGETHV